MIATLLLTLSTWDPDQCPNREEGFRSAYLKVPLWFQVAMARVCTACSKLLGGGGGGAAAVAAAGC